ncbi:MAG TPA: spore germination protein GerW family protein [Jiangellaceae bacterium]
MDVQNVIAQARDMITVKRVFGEPYEADGVTVIPAAKVVGGAGGGEGERPQDREKGAGSGFGVVARPVGAYLIRGDQVSWRPAVDVNRIMLGSQVVMAIALLTIRTIVKARAQSRTR